MLLRAISPYLAVLQLTLDAFVTGPWIYLGPWKRSPIDVVVSTGLLRISVRICQVTARSMIMEAQADFTIILVAITVRTLTEAVMATHTKAAVPRRNTAVPVDKTQNLEGEDSRTVLIV